MSEVAVKKYIVRLSMEERETLEALISKGKHPAAQVLKARILLKADVSEAGEGWSDSRIVKALDTSEATVFRTRQRLVEEGLRGGACPQTFPELGPAANLRRRGRGQTDRPDVFATAERTREGVLASAGRQGGGSEHR